MRNMSKFNKEVVNSGYISVLFLLISLSTCPIRAFESCVLSYFTCLVSYMLSFFTYLVPYMFSCLTCLTCSCISSVFCFACSQAARFLCSSTLSCFRCCKPNMLLCISSHVFVLLVLFLFELFTAWAKANHRDI